jgi:glycolate oxidase
MTDANGNSGSEHRFNRVTGPVLAELREVCGAEHVISDPDQLVCYSYDATKERSLPEVAVAPGSSEEVAAVLRIANDKLLSVCARGAATGLTGGAVPVCGGIVVDMKRMNRILEIDGDNLLAVVQPGVVTGELQKIVEERGLFYPPDPASSDYCTIGGNVAEGAGGLRCVKYGVTRDYVLGMEVALANGSLMRVGGRTIKNVTGYDLTRLMVGSEGTLGIVTEITLRLIPQPEAVRTLVAQFGSAEDALAVVVATARAGIVPRALEFLDTHTLDALRKYSDHGFPAEAGSVLLVEVDGREEAVDREAADILSICEEQGAINIDRADSAVERDQAWSARRAVSPALYTIAQGKMNEDICVPKTRIIEVLKFITELRDELDLTIACFGHAGDGNMHVNFMYDPTDSHALERARQGVERLFRKTVSVGGTLSGEHGIGTSKKDYMPIELTEETLALMRELKRVFDPNGILNPGKIFPT